MVDTTDGFPFKDAVGNIRYAATKVISTFHFRKQINYDSAGNEIVGTKTDAKSTATDTTSVSLMSVFKQISASVQSLVTLGSKPATGTSTQVASNGATPVTVLALNANRLGASVFNDSNQLAYLLLGAGTVSATVHTVQVAAQGFYEVPFNFTGVLTAIHASSNGSWRVTEFTA